MNDKKTNNKVGVFGKLKKVLNSIVKAYISEVETNSSVEVSVFEKKFDGVKKTILEDQAKLKEEIRLTKSELKEVMAAAKKSVIDLYNGKVSFEDDFMEEFGDFDFDDEDFEEFDDSFESEEAVPIQIHVDNSQLNSIAMSILFEVARKDADFAKYMKEKETTITDLINRVIVTKYNPEDTNFINHQTYVSLSNEAIEIAASYGPIPIKDDKIELETGKRNSLVKETSEILHELMKIFRDDSVATLATHSVLNKVYAIYLDYYYYYDNRVEKDKFDTQIGVISFFTDRVLVPKVKFIEDFNFICYCSTELTSSYSTVDVTALAIAFKYGLLNLADKHPELHSRLMSFVVRCHEEISNVSDAFSKNENA
mgnify:CR=1 FL=1